MSPSGLPQGEMIFFCFCFGFYHACGHQSICSLALFVFPHFINRPCPPILRLAARLVCSALLQALVQRVKPELADMSDGVVVDAILSIDTERPSLKPLYRSALQVTAFVWRCLPGGTNRV